MTKIVTIILFITIMVLSVGCGEKHRQVKIFRNDVAITDEQLVEINEFMMENEFYFTHMVYDDDGNLKAMEIWTKEK